MHKIQKVSRALRNLCFLVIVALPLLVASFWLSNGQIFGSDYTSMHFLPMSMTHVNIGTLSPLTKLLAFLVQCIPLSISLSIAWSLTRLLKKYEQLDIFSSEAVGYLRKIGILLLVSQAIHPIYEMLLTLTMTFQNPPGQRFISISIGSPQLTAIFAGCLLLVISWIMNEGRKLQEEQKLVV